MPFLFAFFAICASAGADPSVRYAKLLPYNPHRNEPNAALSKGKFLIASPKIGDPRFAQTVILLTDYGPDGAVGIIINRRTAIRLSDALPDLKGVKGRNEAVYYGGPVNVNNSMSVLVRSASPLKESYPVFDGVYVTASRNVLEELLVSGGAVPAFRVYAGYAGWAPQQLDGEISSGGWTVVDADSAVIFDKDPADVWPDFMR